MIERIVVENFKSLRKVDLSLGRMNLFIGTNASGKSNFLDVLRVLQGIGNGLTIGEVLDGKPKSVLSEAWGGIRGGSRFACFAGERDTDQVYISACGAREGPPPQRSEYAITFSPSRGKVVHEAIRIGETMWELEELEELPDGNGRSRPTLTEYAQLERDSRDRDSAEELPDLASLVWLFANVQRIDPDPAILRGYSQPFQARRMGEHGEDFAALIKTIAQDEDALDAYLAWLRQLRPAEVDDVGTLAGALGEPMFVLRENGNEFPAPVLSDGTLRFAAVTPAFFQPEMPSIMMFEEIENGIHPSRTRLLIELLRSQARIGETRIVATTHSPMVLEWLQEDEYATTFLCKRDESTGESMILPLSEVPRFSDLVKHHPISELLSEGWLEMAS